MSANLSTNISATNHQKQNLIKILANIISGNLIALGGKMQKPVSDLVKSSDLVTLAELFEKKQINNQGLQKALEYLSQNQSSNLQQVLDELNLVQISDESQLLGIVKKVLEQNSDQVKEYLSGKIQLLGFFVGQCMKQSSGQGDPVKFNQLLKRELEIIEIV